MIRSMGYNFYKNVIDDFYSYNPIEAFKRDEIKSSYNYFKEYFYNSILLNSVKSIRVYSIKKSLEFANLKNEDELFLEFGVHIGKTINLFSNFLEEKDKKIFGFDSFAGHLYDWPGYIHEKGSLKLNKKHMQKLNFNVEIVEGLVEKTLDNFLDKHKQKKILFTHMDLDHYPSTIFVLKKIKPFLSNNSIILFNALHNYSGWKNGVIKAINETFEKKEFEFIAFNSKIQGVLKYKKS